jgi:DNA-binding transcriptional LysR family regulator
LKNLASETFVGFPFKEGPGFESVVLTACQENGFTPNFVQVASQMQSILAFVAGGLGVALVPQSMQAIAMENVHYVQVRSGRQAIQYSLGLAYKQSNDNPAVAAFLATAHRLGSRQF